MIPVFNVLFKWHHFPNLETLRFGFSSGKPRSEIEDTLVEEIKMDWQKLMFVNPFAMHLVLGVGITFPLIESHFIKKAIKINF